MISLHVIGIQSNLELIIYSIFPRISGFVFMGPLTCMTGITVVVLLRVADIASQIRAIRAVAIGPVLGMVDVIIPIALKASENETILPD